MNTTPTSHAIIYGISNCDTVKKARKWLLSQQLTVPFQDLRENPITQSQLSTWVKMAGWETILNKRSTSFRQLSDGNKQNIDEQKAIGLMLAQPTLIKRPVLFDGKKIAVGFKEAEYQKWFNL